MKRTAIDKYRSLEEANAIPQIVYEVARLEQLLRVARSDMYRELRRNHWTASELRQAGIKKTRV